MHTRSCTREPAVKSCTPIPGRRKFKMLQMELPANPRMLFTVALGVAEFFNENYKG